MDLIIHNIDMPFFFYLLQCTMYVCMYVSVLVFSCTSNGTQISKWVSIKLPKGSHALYLLPLDFNIFIPRC